MYNKKFELIKYKNMSLDNKLEKYLTNFLGIYNTKREKSHRKSNDCTNDKMHKKQTRRFDVKNLISYNNINKRLKLRIKSACPALMANKVKGEKKQDMMKMIRYIDRNKRYYIYKN